MKATIVIFLLTVPFAQERTVRGVMQARPGADAEDVEVKVHPVPVDPVGSRYSCGFPMVETEQPAEPFTALNGAL